MKAGCASPSPKALLQVAGNWMKQKSGPTSLPCPSTTRLPEAEKLRGHSPLPPQEHLARPHALLQITQTWALAPREKAKAKKDITEVAGARDSSFGGSFPNKLSGFLEIQAT